MLRVKSLPNIISNGVPPDGYGPSLEMVFLCGRRPLITVEDPGRLKALWIGRHDVVVGNYMYIRRQA